MVNESDEEVGKMTEKKEKTENERIGKNKKERRRKSPHDMRWHLLYLFGRKAEILHRLQDNAEVVVISDAVDRKTAGVSRQILKVRGIWPIIRRSLSNLL